MKAARSIALSSTLALCLELQVPFVDAQVSSCTGNAPQYLSPSRGSCMMSWSQGGRYNYPTDFDGILNQVTVYRCPESNKRVILSNGIPDHDVLQMNVNSPCVTSWAVSMPLNPSKADKRTETPTKGIMAMAINGVPAYGAQEVSDENAVEPTGSVTDAQYWYGHADADKYWHVHNPYLGKENPSSDTLLGYALDGFPIYGPLEDDSTLDKCNGRTDGQGNYKYHVRTTDQVDETLDYCDGTMPWNNWNYILGCYSGSLSDTTVEDSTTFVLPSDCRVPTEEDSIEEEDIDNKVERTEQKEDNFFLLLMRLAH